MNTWIFHILQILPLIFAVVLHEVAHGYVAKRLGDPTASVAGRLTLNPIKHIDLFWTIILPIVLIVSGSPVLFGGAKPVPVDPRYFPRPRRGMMWVAAAGPLTNICLAILSILAFWGILIIGDGIFVDVSLDASLRHSWFMSSNMIYDLKPAMLSLYYAALLLINSIFVNTILAAFNLLPFPPLDGSKILIGIVPWEMAQRLIRLEKFGILLIFGFLYVGGFDYIAKYLIYGLSLILSLL